MPTTLKTIIVTDQETISNGAFFNMDYLETVVLPFGQNANDPNSTNYNDVGLPEIYDDIEWGTRSLKTIQTGAFWSCGALKEIYIPK